MTGKRKRAEGFQSHTEPLSKYSRMICDRKIHLITSDLETASTSEKPLSAIAAARLKAEATTKGVVTPDVTIKRAFEPSSVLADSPVPESGESEAEEEPAIVRRNLKLCNWRNEAQNILSDTDSDLTVKLNKHSTIALIGYFSFKVLRGAININGANIGVVSRNGQKDQVYTAYAPATHPISKFRGIDSTNHIQFTNCEMPVPLSNINPLFTGIWSVQVEADTKRTFTVVRHYLFLAC
jgi:polynucleotide 5'-hydroxyl-kinase GRC3/NOL9